MSKDTTSAEDRHRAELVREATAARARRRAAEATAAVRRVVDRINGKPAAKAESTVTDPHGWRAVIAKKAGQPDNAGGAKASWAKAIAAVNEWRRG